MLSASVKKESFHLLQPWELRANMLDVITNLITKLALLPHELLYTLVHMAYKIITLNNNHL
jgi:hypothetical protein